MRDFFYAPASGTMIYIAPSPSFRNDVMKSSYAAVRVAFAVLCAAFSASTRADTPGCTPITYLPITISSPGVYCLTGHLRSSQGSGQAILVTAGFVTIDLNGWSLDGSDGGSTSTATGIYSTLQHTTVRNGSVTGFQTGIFVSGIGSAVQKVAVSHNRYIGIFSNSQGAAITDNQIIASGGLPQAAHVYGIVSNGAGSLLAGNYIWNIAPTLGGTEYGIYAMGANTTARNNVVTDLDRPTVSGSYSYGIFVKNGSAYGNEVTNFATCYYISGVYANNVAYNCSTNYALVGTAGSGNSP
jgi:hypothetical protein